MLAFSNGGRLWFKSGSSMDTNMTTVVAFILVDFVFVIYLHRFDIFFNQQQKLIHEPIYYVAVREKQTFCLFLMTFGILGHFLIS